jgi:kynurenine formamidase
MASETQVHNLTLPVSPFFPVGSVFPWDSPHQREDIVTVERNRAHLFHIRMGSGTGTRLRTDGFGSGTGRDTDELELANLVNLDTVVLRIPKGRAEPVERDDVIRALAAAGDPDGAAVMVVTGWGDGRRYAELGEDYVLASPYFTDEAAAELASVMMANRVAMLLTDCADVDPPGGQFAREEWAGLVPWLRPPWPSDQAKAYLRHYSRDKAQKDRAPSLILTGTAPLVVGLAGCGALTAARVRLTALPLAVAGAAEAPCTVVVETDR